MKILQAIGLFLLMLTANKSNAIDLEQSDFPIETLKVPNSLARASPEFSTFSVEVDQEGNTYIAVGLGIEKYSIPDSPAAGIWRILVANGRPNLQELTVTDDLKHSLIPYDALQRPIPLGCGDAFIQECSSYDNRLKIALTFDGKHYKKKTSAGLFSGQQSDIEYDFYNGTRKLVITDNTTGKKAIFYENLDDTPEYVVFSDRLVYLAKENLVVLFPPISSKQSTLVILLK